MLSNFCLRVLLLILWQGRFWLSTKFRQFFRSMTNCPKQVGLKLIFITIYGLRCFCEEAREVQGKFNGTGFVERRLQWSFDIILMRSVHQMTCIPVLLCVFAYAVSFFSMVSIYNLCNVIFGTVCFLVASYTLCALIHCPQKTFAEQNPAVDKYRHHDSVKHGQFVFRIVDPVENGWFIW